jgi:hypothetical protein
MPSLMAAQTENNVFDSSGTCGTRFNISRPLQPGTARLPFPIAGASGTSFPKIPHPRLLEDAIITYALAGGYTT